MVLLIGDVLCVCAEILIGFHILYTELEYAEGQVHALQAGQGNCTNGTGVHARAFSLGARAGRPAWSIRAAAAAPAHGAGHPDLHAWEEAEHIIHMASIAILCVFAAEIVLLCIGLGARFFQHPLYVLDAGIIGAALWLDLTVTVDQGGGLLILLRVWRLLRIVHGAFTVEHHETRRNEKEHDELIEKVEKAITNALTAGARETAGAPYLMMALQLLRDEETSAQQNRSGPVYSVPVIVAPAQSSVHSRLTVGSVVLPLS